MPNETASAATARAPVAARPIQAAAISEVGQLQLGLPPELARLAIAPEWKDQQRLWGHSYHPMCSYLASFPAALTHAFIARWSRPGDVVLDPFSGRGTTPLQACAEGRVGAGNDLNPLAHLLTAAKVDPPTQAEAMTRLATLRLAWSRDAEAWDALAADALADPARVRVPKAGSGADAFSATGAETGAPSAGEAIPAEVALAFHRRTFGQLLFVRSALLSDERTDRFLLGALAGILHGKSPSYLSEIMPNTFSMAPRYVRDFVARTGFSSPERDVFACLDAQAPPPRPATGAADARIRAARGCPRRRNALPVGPARAFPARAGPARRYLAALPAGREIRLLQLAANLAARRRRA